MNQKQQIDVAPAGSIVGYGLRMKGLSLPMVSGWFETPGEAEALKNHHVRKSDSMEIVRLTCEPYKP